MSTYNASSKLVVLETYAKPNLAYQFGSQGLVFQMIQESLQYKGKHL